MADNTTFFLQPDDVMEATHKLDELAARMETLMRDEAANLTPPAPGHDEVSQQVAATFDAVQAEFGTATQQGVAEIREMAATLRAHVNDVLAIQQNMAL